MGINHRFNVVYTLLYECKLKIIQMKKQKLEYTEEMLEDLKNFKTEDIQSTEEEKVKEVFF